MFARGTARFLLPSLGLILVIAALAALGKLPGGYELWVLLAIGASYWAFFAGFFRDPERAPGPGIVAPADGRVVSIERADGQVRVATFMNVTDVHVNRFPIDGRIVSIETSGDGFRPAYVPDARHNLQRRYVLETAIGPVEVIQMTGLVARRLVSFLGEGAKGAKGDRLGMIVLGSRVDLLMPSDAVELRVEVGARVRAGTTEIARER